MARCHRHRWSATLRGYGRLLRRQQRRERRHAVAVVPLRARFRTRAGRVATDDAGLVHSRLHAGRPVRRGLHPGLGRSAAAAAGAAVTTIVAHQRFVRLRRPPRLPQPAKLFQSQSARDATGAIEHHLDHRRWPGVSGASAARDTTNCGRGAPQHETGPRWPGGRSIGSGRRGAVDKIGAERRQPPAQSGRRSIHARQRHDADVGAHQRR